jgi:hypothetical protein
MNRMAIASPQKFATNLGYVISNVKTCSSSAVLKFWTINYVQIGRPFRQLNPYLGN